MPLSPSPLPPATNVFEDKHLRTVLFLCEYEVDIATGGMRAVHDTLGSQLTAYFFDQDAWPVCQCLTLGAPRPGEAGKLRVTHHLLLTWIPRHVWEAQQAAAMAAAMAIREQERLRYDSIPQPSDHPAAPDPQGDGVGGVPPDPLPRYNCGWTYSDA